ncbi:8375_t:CDS:2 [Funneliformis caledonium]|uniref:8375_t:CDS:1 n=1 Tax=Funneliformis caledonium TaxID=1117310 RepID=A0A9N8YS07_9GLOM|nr:8375_t:CDS:2 [Funneliformis caledonium]
MSDTSLVIRIEKEVNGKDIIEISPNAKCIASYNEVEKKIVVWNTKEGKLKPDDTVNQFDTKKSISQMCVSDEKVVAFNYAERTADKDNVHQDLKIIDLNNPDQEIELRFKRIILSYSCNFNSKGEFIFYTTCEHHVVIWVYSTQSKGNKWMCLKIYKLPKGTEFISISRNDKILLRMENYINEFNIETGNTKIISNNILGAETKDIRISSNDKFTFLKINDEIIVYSDKLEIPIALLDSNDGLRLYKFMKQHTDLRSLLLSLFDYKSNNKTWISCLNQITKDSLLRNNQPWNSFLDQLTKDHSLVKNNLPIIFLQNHLYVFVNGSVFKIKFELDIIPLSEELNINDDAENWMAYFGSENVDEKKTNNPYEYEDPFIPNMIIDTSKLESPQKESNLQNINVKIYTEVEIIGLRVYRKVNKPELKFIDESFHKTKYEKGIEIYEVGVFENNDIAILTNIGIFIFHLSENDKILLKYFHYIHRPEQNIKSIGKLLRLTKNSMFSFDYKELIKEWVSYVNNDKNQFLKNGPGLLIFAIKMHDLKLISDIYKKCLNYFKQDLENNKMFLSIITTSMPLLEKYYPEYLTRYSLDTNMIIDSLDYKIEHIEYSSLHPFTKNIKVVNLTRSIWWSIYAKRWEEDQDMAINIIVLFQLIIGILMFPIYASICLILDYFHIINDIYYDGVTIYYYFFCILLEFIKSEIHKESKPTITFIIPYIKFVSYPQAYSWWKELIKPQPSPFVETISRDIYKKLNGEALIDFKWNSYGKYYYAIIWMGFIALLGCFTVAATFSNNIISNNIREQLLIASIILGLIHLTFEIRQLIYNTFKWIHDIWNFFGMLNNITIKVLQGYGVSINSYLFFIDIAAYLLTICASIYWYQTNDRNVQLLSITCLFLDIKFLLFFRVFESFGVYFAIIISVAKRIISFLVVLGIILISFAHAFYILLSLEDPWNITTTFTTYDQKGSTDPNPFIIQTPDENTNMFSYYGTALFAIYLFLTGDSSAFTPWPYKNNSMLVVLMVLFSFVVVVYLMNLFIGLLNIEIEKDNNRVSYLIQKAKILAEIELIYLLPHQRRWKSWFPEVIHYNADVDEVRRRVNELIKNNEWGSDEFPEMNKKLLKTLDIRK